MQRRTVLCCSAKLVLPTSMFIVKCRRPPCNYLTTFNVISKETIKNA